MPRVVHFEIPVDDADRGVACGVGHVACCTDTEGNTFSVIQGE